MNIPDNLKYTKTHEWVKVEGNLAITGITDFAQQELSDIVYVEVAALGREVKAGDTVGTIEAVKAVADLYAPVSGRVIAVNEAVSAAPDTVNKDPYGAGWLTRIEFTNQDELAGLMDASEYAELVRKSAHH
uniref:Glycine cleavage system H protein n=1 Tax=candidate division WOR-3 bacterium TaxID=2052148 RepID=A0A7C4GCP6_UNCW3